ncbi:MAG: beta-galactosidase [Bryobacteraceae bacterium]
MQTLGKGCRQRWLHAPLLWLLLVAPAASQDLLYDPVFRPQPVRIVPYAELNQWKPSSALVRMPNHKLAIMVRDEAGRMQPFLVRGIETGYWDTRRANQNTDFDQVFANYRRLGANTSFFMIHWADIEPADGKFDFSYTDRIVDLARKHGIKLWWVLFLHCQSDHPPELRDFWAYKIDTREGKNYAMQWLRDENGVVYDSMAKLATLPGRREITPAYGHPQVFPKILRMLTRLGEHYRDSAAVLGVQIDNEAGFGYYTPRGTTGPQKLESDFNPVTAQIFEEWKLKTGNSDWHAFKLSIVKYWWKQFTSAFHKGDPYKLTSFNFLGANAEAGNAYWIDLEGVDVTTYGEGNIDVVSSMFYGPNNGPKVWANLDQHYNFAYEVPIFISSEIGLGSRFGSEALFQQYVINSLERGAQGYASYDYGSLMGEGGQPNLYGEFFRNLAAMVEACEDILYGGVPGPGRVSIVSAAPGAKVSLLNAPAGTAGILHFPEAAFRPAPQTGTPGADVAVEIRALATGDYTVQVYRADRLTDSSLLRLAANRTHRLTIPQMGQTEAVFLKVLYPRPSSSTGRGPTTGGKKP